MVHRRRSGHVSRPAGCIPAGLVGWTGLPEGLPTRDVAALYASHPQQLW
jgi:hypothetical protein